MSVMGLMRPTMAVICWFVIHDTALGSRYRLGELTYLKHGDKAVFTIVPLIPESVLTTDDAKAVSGPEVELQAAAASEVAGRASEFILQSFNEHYGPESAHYDADVLQYVNTTLRQDVEKLLDGRSITLVMFKRDLTKPASTHAAALNFGDVVGTLKSTFLVDRTDVLPVERGSDPLFPNVIRSHEDGSHREGLREPKLEPKRIRHGSDDAQSIESDVTQSPLNRRRELKHLVRVKGERVDIVSLLFHFAGKYGLTDAIHRRDAQNPAKVVIDVPSTMYIHCPTQLVRYYETRLGFNLREAVQKDVGSVMWADPYVLRTKVAREWIHYHTRGEGPSPVVHFLLENEIRFLVEPRVGALAKYHLGFGDPNIRPEIRFLNDLHVSNGSVPLNACYHVYNGFFHRFRARFVLAPSL